MSKPKERALLDISDEDFDKFVDTCLDYRTFSKTGKVKVSLSIEEISERLGIKPLNNSTIAAVLRALAKRVGVRCAPSGGCGGTVEFRER